ncbi:uncharacterized protein LOC134214924 [Armigeres subalbatus]|uniref:uncharacterized protein LOC134214924 n=1 Tax=Armigeres subalbatus TaxID=124917 RepID=UPI002ED69060
MAPPQTHNRSEHSSDTEENTSTEFEDFSCDSEDILGIDDEELLSDSMECSDESSSLGDTYLKKSKNMSESRMVQIAISTNVKSLKPIDEDADDSMRSNSFEDTVSTDMSIDPDWISTDEEEAIEDYLVYKEACRQQKQARIAHQREVEEYEDRDEVNFRYLTSEIAAAKGKPSTMVSYAGAAALINMRRVIIPASEMLRNYFRSTESNRAIKGDKENAYVCKNLVDSVVGKSNRIALSDKN